MLSHLFSHQDIRDLIGCAVGGLTGIMTATVTYMYLLPVTTSVGAFLGFYYREVYVLITQGFWRWLAESQKRWRRSVEETKISDVTHRVSTTGKRLKEGVVSYAKSAGNSVVAKLKEKIPDFSTRAKYARDAVTISHVLAVVAFIYFSAQWLSPVLPHPYGAVGGYGSEAGWLMTFAAHFAATEFAILITVVTLAPATASWHDLPRDHNYQDAGAAYYGVAYACGYVSYGFRKAVTGFVLANYFALAVPTYLTIAFVPSVSFMLIFRGIKRLAKRRDHLPCVLVTVIVTYLSANLFAAYLYLPVAWLVGLFTGLGAGLLTIQVRKLTGLIYSKFSKVERLARASFWVWMRKPNRFFRHLNTQVYQSLP
jgi:hypothetical protein